MRPGIHPTYYPEATVTCACGNTWKTGSTVESIHTDVCSNCHPFYTGEQRIVDTEGQVERFYKKLQARQEYLEEHETRESGLALLDLPIADLELGVRAEKSLTQAGVTTVGQALDRLQQGEEALLSIEGFGRKSLVDLKKRLRQRGLTLPEEAEGSAS